MKNVSLNAGQSLIELLIVMALAAVLLPAFLTGFVSSREGKAQQGQRQQAVAYVREAETAARAKRDQGWSTFPANGTYHPVIQSSQWNLVSGSETINGYTRQIVISDAYRSSLSGPIVSSGTSGAVADPSTKKIDITVSWTQPYSSSITSTVYLTRYLDNATYTETTQTHFNAGTKTGTNVRATTPPGVTDDGEVVLGAGGYGDWCSPNLTSVASDLPGNGVANGIWAIEGKAFVGTGDNASGMDFINVSISNPAHPANPVVTTQGTFDQNLKTNDVFGENVSGINYGYISTNNNGSEITILNASNNPPTEVSSINLPGSASGTTVYVSNNILYATSGTTLYTYDVTNRSSPQSRGSISLPSSASKIYVVNSYVYVALNSTSTQLKIINATNVSSLQNAGQLQVNSSVAKTIYVNSSGDRTYLATSTSSQEEFYIINTSNKSSPALVSSTSKYETSGMDPKSIVITTGNRAIIVGSGGHQYQVINLDNENSPSQCGYADTPDSLQGVSTVLETDGDAYSYVITANGSSEFRIIAGGPGGSYATSGSFESATFNPGYSTANNRLTATFTEPSGTDIQFQVSLAAMVSGSCPTTGSYTFVGPDGTSNTRFNQTSGTAITFPFATYAPSYVNPGQCMRYKVFLTTTNSNASPILYDVTVNYSP